MQVNDKFTAAVEKYLGKFIVVREREYPRARLCVGVTLSIDGSVTILLRSEDLGGLAHFMPEEVEVASEPVRKL